MEKKKKIAKYSFEKVQETFLLNNCNLLTKTYKKNTDVLKFICKCKVENEMSFKKYLVQLCCNECHSKTLTRRFKYTYQQVKKTFEDNKCQLISTEYKNQITNLDYICECKNEAKITFKMFLEGQRCQKCAIRKRKETNLERYGNEVSMNSDNLKEIWVEKIKNRTEEEKEEIQNKRKLTNLEKYGVEHTLQSKEIRDKGKETYLEKYGVKCGLQVQEIRDKGKETMMERYGVEHPMQNAELSEKMLIKSKKYKKYILPSGKETNVQGYENFALDILLKEFTEDEILNSRTDMPVIRYYYKNVNRRYFPDIYIPKLNKIIEVKSIWTYKRDLVKNIIKAIYTRKLGYDYEVWLFDKKQLINTF
jgi:hypothetical protein